MLCNEPIIAAYSGQPNYESGYSRLDCFYDMKLYQSSKNREILETEHYYILLESNDVKVINKTSPIKGIAKDGEWIEPYLQIDDGDPEDIWTEYESTLFVGEKVVDVYYMDDGYIVQFENFKLKVVCVEPDYDCPFDYIIFPHSYSRVLGTERLITRKCSCGGTGELIIDFVSDYIVRCNKCHVSTWANQCACDAIDEWNEAYDISGAFELPEEEFATVINQPVNYIAFHEFADIDYGDTSRCESIMLSIGESKFQIETRYAANEVYNFAFDRYSSFNPKVWPNSIFSSEDAPINLIGRLSEGRKYEELQFRIGDKMLSIIAGEKALIIEVHDEDHKLEKLLVPTVSK